MDHWIYTICQQANINVRQLQVWVKREECFIIKGINTLAINTAIVKFMSALCLVCTSF